MAFSLFAYGVAVRSHAISLTKMKTLLSVFGIKPQRIGGQEVFARELSSQLGLHGWNSVLCFAGQPPERVRCYLQLPNVSIDLLENSHEASWRTIKGMAQMLRRHQPDILHLYYTGFIGPYPWLARLFSVKKTCFTDQTSRPEGFVARRAPAWKRLATRLINFPVSHVICVSEYGYRCMAEMGLLPGERFHVVYNSVDLGRVSEELEQSAAFRRRYSIPATRAIVAQVSWIIPEKGIGDFLQAARIILSRNRDVHFVLVGEGAYRKQYMRQALEIGLGEHLTWTGLVEDPFSEGVYAAADVVCQMSRWGEVFGYVIAEAMAWGKPVVATRVGGVPELIRDGENGFLVPRGDVAATAENVLQLIANKELRARMGLAARRLAGARFDVAQNVSQLLKLYGIAP